MYNLWVAVAFMWGWAAAIIIIGLPLYEHRSAVNNGPFLSSARARLLCLDCYACARQLCLPRAGLTDLSDMILPGRGGDLALDARALPRASRLLSRLFHHLWPSRNRTTFLAVLTCNTKMNAPENKKDKSTKVEMREADDEKL